MTAAAVSLVAVPPDWGIQKLYSDVQKAVDQFFATIRDIGFAPNQAVRVWMEMVEWLLERRPISVAHKARDTVTHRWVRPGRVLQQVGRLADRLIRFTVELFTGTPDRQTTVVPAFFHSQTKIARALKLGGEYGADRQWRPKPVHRNQRGELLDPPGVRHTRELLDICVDELKVLRAFDRRSEKGHELNHEARTKVHVLQIPEEAMGFLRDLHARWHGDGSERPKAAGGRGTPAPAPSSGRAAASPAPKPPPAGKAAPAFGPAVTAPEPVRQLQAIFLARHEAKYRAKDTAEGRPYAQGDPRIAAEHWPELAEALEWFARDASKRAVSKGWLVSDVAEQRGENVVQSADVRREVFEKIVDVYLAGSGEWLDPKRHPLGGVWSWSKVIKNRELFSLGARAVDLWIEQRGVAEWGSAPAPPREPELQADAEQPPLEDGPMVEIDDGTVDETEADREEARRACEALRARVCAAEEEAPASGPVESEELVPAPRSRAELKRALADIDAGRPVRLVQKPP
jgi:hypothetical protein